MTQAQAQTQSSKSSEWVTTLIQELWEAPQNDLQSAEPERAWDPPLVGFAGGADPLFAQYKRVVGPFHWTPAEAFEQGFPDETADPGALTVIAWVLPQTTATRRDQRAETVYPSERWARSRIYGEQFNRWLRDQLVVRLTEAGCPAVAPMALPAWSVKDSETYVYASTWSERHAAYAAGLGTFGLCDGLITPRGKAMRVGSVVAQIDLPPTPRPYTDHHAYCLYYANGTCGDCIGQCPVSAISAAGHDKVVCRAHLDRTRRYVEATYGFEGYGCGLCQVGVPCASRIPEGIETGSAFPEVSRGA